MITIAPCAPADVMHHLVSIQSPKTDRDGIIDLDSLIGQGTTYRMMENGGTVGAFILCGYGTLLWVLAAAGRATGDLTRTVLATLEQQGRAGGYTALGFRTERCGLVRKAGRYGYRVTGRDGQGYFLQRDIK